MKFDIPSLAVLAAVLPLAVGGCDQGVAGPGGDEATFGVVFAPEAGAGMTASFDRIGPAGPAGATISLATVASIVLPIGHVEARTADDAWVEAGAIDADVDLLDLPADGIELLESALPQGQYTALRFWLTGDASITLGEAVTVGRTTFDAGTYTLEIPSADQNGVRLRADFEVTEDGQLLTVLVDGDATIRRVIATGAGVLKIAPVLSVQNRQGEHVGGIDDDTGDGGPGNGPGAGQAAGEREGLVTAVDADAGAFTLDDSVTVRVTDETEYSGDFFSLEDVAAAVADGEIVEAEVHGPVADDGAIDAHRVEFETDDDDGDGEVDDADDGEVEVRGRVTALDRDAMTFEVMHRMETVTVTIDGDTELDFDAPYESWDDVADAFDAGDAVRAEAEGQWSDDGELLAWEVDFAEAGQHGGGGGGGPGG